MTKEDFLNELNKISCTDFSKKDIEFTTIDINEILTYEIKKDKGLGDIYFGMSEKEFVQKYVSYKFVDEGIMKIESILLDNSLHCYEFFDSIKISIDRKEGVTSIILQNNFQGKYKNIIGINNTYSEIKNALIKMNEYGGYYEEYLLVGEKKNFLITFDFTSVDPNDTEILEDWMEWKEDKGEEIIKDCKVDYIVIHR